MSVDPETTRRTVAPEFIRAHGDSRDVGLLIARLAVGVIMMGHGSQKLFGWFGGNGLDGTARMFNASGYSPGKLFALIAGGTEFGGGLLLALGFLTPLAGAAVLGVMINAVALTHGAGFWSQQGGFEYALVLGVIGAAFAFTGGGRFSVDRGQPWEHGGHRIGMGVLALSVVLAAATLVLKAM